MCPSDFRPPAADCYAPTNPSQGGRASRYKLRPPSGFGLQSAATISTRRERLFARIRPRTQPGDGVETAIVELTDPVRLF